jgi:hypothetical protein
MAIYHCSIKIISRGKGKSAVAAAAYRSGECITNDYDGVTHDFSRKRGIVHTEILLPGHSPREFENRSVLWNSVEKIEKQKNSQLAREIEIALPAELTIEQNISLARKFVKEQFVDKGMCADVAVHDKGDGNVHTHILLTMRPLNEDGSWGAKVVKVNGKKTYPVDWDNRDNAELWRRAWAAYCNTALRINGHDSVVDHRSYERQGVEQIPTVHLGVVASRLERRGIETDLGNRNREIDALNSKLRQINARIRKLEDWKADLIAAPPTLYDLYSEMVKHPGHRSQRQVMDDLDLAVSTHNFMVKYDIETLTDMAEVVKNMRLQYDSLKIKTTETARRYATLSEHIRQAEVYGKNAKVYEQWRGMKEGGKKEQFYGKHKNEIAAFTEAYKYMTRHLNGRKERPLDAWRREFTTVKNKHAMLLADSDKLSKELKSAESMKRSAEKVMGVEQQTKNRRYTIGE